MAILIFTGLRRGEVIALLREDLDFKDGSVRVQCGKGGKARTVYICDEGLAILRAYLDIRPADVTTPYLLAFNRKDRVGVNALYSILRDVKAVAGLNNQHMTLHQFRHSFATRAMQQETPLPVVQAQLGHGSIKTTAIYLHTTADIQRKFANRAGLLPAPQPTSEPLTTEPPPLLPEPEPQPEPEPEPEPPVVAAPPKTAKASAKAAKPAAPSQKVPPAPRKEERARFRDRRDEPPTAAPRQRIDLRKPAPKPVVRQNRSGLRRRD